MTAPVSDGDNGNNDVICEYTRYFSKVLNAIQEMQEINAHSIPMMQKMLYFCCLDTWAGGAFQRLQNRQCFVKFLDEISGWHFRDRVSVPQLSIALSNPNRIARLTAWLTERQNEFQIYQRYTANDDPVDCQLINLAESRKERDLIDCCRYPNLLWNYRNSIVHGFLMPGKATEVRQEKTPYYVSVNADTQKECNECEAECGEKCDGDESYTRELVLCNAFLHHLCESSLQAFAVWLRNHGKNPYDGAELMTSWKRARK